MVKTTQTVHRQEPTNYLRVFDHFVGLALKGLREWTLALELLVWYSEFNPENDP